MKTIFVAIVLFFGSHKLIRAQEKSNVSESYRVLAMISLFSEGLNNEEVEVSKESLVKFLSENVGITIINQKSFKDYVFLSIDPFQRRKYIDDLSLPQIWTANDCKEYILAINKGSRYTYKLKGYHNNEFYSFLREIKKNENYLGTKSPKSFVKNYKVEGLDFRCLYNSLINRKNKKYPCVDNNCLKIYRTHDF